MATELLAASAPLFPLPAQPQRTGVDCFVPDDAAVLGGPLTLRDGRRVRVRAIRPDDGQRLCAFHERLSPESVHLRYGGARAAPSEEEETRELARVDYERRMAVVATAGAGDAEERIVAAVEYILLAPAAAEVAFLVEDAWQGLGLGTQLLHALAAYARRRGIVTLIAAVMAHNVRMLGLLRRCGFPYAEYEDDPTCVAVHLDITASPG